MHSILLSHFSNIAPMLLFILLVMIVLFRGFLKIDAKKADDENVFPNQPINIKTMQATENTGALADPKEASEAVSGNAAEAAAETKPEEKAAEETAQAAE